MFNFKIIGSGAFGQALGRFLPNSEVFSSKFKPLLNSNDILIPAIPSKFTADFLKNFFDSNKSEPAAIMLVSKGLSSSKLLSFEVAEVLDLPILFLAGPNLSKEMEHDSKLLSFSIAGPDSFKEPIIKSIPNAIIEYSNDLTLVQIASVIKNITAFLIGYLNLGENARSALIMQGMKEAIKLSYLLNGKSEVNLESILQPCFSDFILTCTSQFSRNFQAGKDFIAKKQEGTKESLSSIYNLFEMIQGFGVCFPLIQATYDVVALKKDIDINSLQENIIKF